MDGLATQCGMVRSAGGGGPWTPPLSPIVWHYGSSTEAGGTQWTDQSGNGNHSTLSNSSSVNANGLTGSGVDDYATTAFNFNLNAGFSLVAWVYGSPTLAEDMGVFGEASEGNFRLWLDVISGPLWQVRSFNPITSGIGSFDLRASWHHVAWVDDGVTMQFYLNGVADGSSSGVLTGTLRRIGWADTGKYIRDGQIDDVLIYDGQALSSSQISDIYNNSPASHL